jgi:hypothetical protein
MNSHRNEGGGEAKKASQSTLTARRIKDVTKKIKWKDTGSDFNEQLEQ